MISLLHFCAMMKFPKDSCTPVTFSPTKLLISTVKWVSIIKDVKSVIDMALTL